MKQTLTIQGRHFVSSRREAIETLFAPIEGRTAHGRYKARRGGIMLYDLQDNPRVFIVNNRHGRFFVSASIHDGRYWYMHGLADSDAEWLGTSELGYAAEIAAASAAINAA